MRLGDVSIQTLQRAIQQGEISALEVAKRTLQAVEQHNPALNAWTEVTGPRMLKEAADVDAQRQRGETLPPLAGIPYAVKNLFDVAGHTTWPVPACSATGRRHVQMRLLSINCVALVRCCLAC